MFVYIVYIYCCFSYLLAAQVKVRGRQDVRHGSESMEQHSGELDDQNEGEEEHEDETDRFQLKVLFGNVDLVKEMRCNK